MRSNIQRVKIRVEIAALIVTILSTGMVYLDQSALNVAMAPLQQSLNIDLGGVQWIHNVYILALSVLLLVGGALGDRYGRVRMLQIGTAIFLLSSLLCAIAPSLLVLVIGRGLQGVGGALLVPGGFAALNATAPPERRPHLLGIWGMFSPLITSMGPVLGGWLTDNVSWRAVFALNLPLGIAAMLLAWRTLPESRDERAHGPLDVSGVITLMLALGGWLFGLIEGPHLGWSSPVVLLSFVVGALMTLAFIRTEWRAVEPLVPLHLFRIRAFTGTTLQTLALYMGMSSLFFFISLYFQQALGLSASVAGFAQLPVPICLFVMSRITGRLMTRVSARALMTLGSALSCVGFYMLSRLTINDPYLTRYLPAQMTFGIGLGLIVVPLTTAAMAALPTRFSGIASGMSNAASRIAQMMAIAVFGGLMLTQFQGSLSRAVPALGLNAAQASELMARSANLGATRAPAGVDQITADAVHLTVRQSFAGAFHSILYVSIALILLSVACLWLVVKLPDEALAASPGTTATG